jgi:hypothetical protein
LDTKLADQTFGDNSAVFFMSEPIMLPSDVYEGHISIKQKGILPSLKAVKRSIVLLKYY